MTNSAPRIINEAAFNELVGKLRRHKAPPADAPLTSRTGRRIHRVLALLGVLFLTAWIGCSSQGSASPAPIDARSNEVILTWNVIAHDAAMAQDGYANGLALVRVYAMMHAAQHDALNAIDLVYDTYAFGGSDPVADPVAAAASAAHGVLSAAFPDQRTTFDEQLARSLESVPDGNAETRGATLGAQAAAAILALRQDDGADAPVIGDYAPGSGPGHYQFTPPYEFAFLPGWRNLQPFALTRADQFRSPPHPALDSEAYARDFNEVKEVGGTNSRVRTDEQLSYAKFWEEFSDMGWNRIGRIVAAERSLGLQSTARLFALLNMAMSDAYVAGWDSKYHYGLWRPVTAIRAADTDGNAVTSADPAWESALETPPVQDYPSTHSALGRAAATVLASVFGDETSFTFTSTSADPANLSRSFTSFSQAADENADSRVMGGLHFRFACDAGQELGRKVAEWTITHYLQKQDALRSNNRTE